MKLSLIICTYMRLEPLSRLLETVQQQTIVPNEILIIDGSTNDATGLRFRESKIQNLHYYKVPPEHRGLTKQRNYGIERVHASMDIVAFLDDDIELDQTYFEKLLEAYETYPAAVGIGGFITNEVHWETVADQQHDSNYYVYDGYARKESSRYQLRKKLGLDHIGPPATFPEFGHARSVGFLPPSGKICKVDLFMGGVASYPKKVLEEHKFSEYFEGYGLYEDADFTLRLSNIGELYVTTAATCKHFHDASGRPNKYNYGKMVVRNGWYVWRVKYPKPSFKNKIKWYQITILLTTIRFLNIFTTSERKEAFTEAVGRTVGLFSLFFNTPK